MYEKVFFISFNLYYFSKEKVTHIRLKKYNMTCKKANWTRFYSRCNNVTRLKRAYVLVFLKRPADVFRSTSLLSDNIANNMKHLHDK